MDHEYMFRQLSRHLAVFRDMLEGASDAETRWRPAPEKWCLLEVVCHLHDEEREDFRFRLRHVLATPETPMPPIDPPGWVTSRRYMEQDFATKLQEFLAEREASVDWLWKLVDAPWKNVHDHPKAGPLSAEKILANWVAHDLHHIRQVNDLRHGYLASVSGVALDYAGPW